MKTVKLPKNDYTVDIFSTTPSGEGVASVEGLIIYVKGAIEGEVHNIQIDRYSGNMAYAHTLERITSSPHRCEPVCPYTGECGGCTLLHVDYELQRIIKRRALSDALTRIGGLSSPHVEETVGMQTPWRYRHKASFPASSVDNSIGFYREGTHSVCSVTDCAVTFAEASDVLNAVRSAHKIGLLPYYNEKKRSGMLRHVVVRKSADSGRVMVVLVLADAPDERIRAACEKIGVLSCVDTVCIDVNTSTGKKIFGGDTEVYCGGGFIVDRLCGYSFKISPESFFQINPMQAQRLYEVAKEYAALTGTENVLDLYCGTGAISLVVSGMAKSVTGVELSADAIDDACRNAAANGVDNCTFVCADAAEYMSELTDNRAGASPDVVMLDPPRKGCDPAVICSLAALSPDRIVYVSCNPATLARDVKLLCTQGEYVFEKATPVDMFCHTSHVECVVSLKRKASK